MKSYFVATLLGALISTSVIAQARVKKQKAKPATTQVSTMPTVKLAEKENKSHFDGFYERLGVSYFGAYTSSPLNSFHADYAITSPKYETKFSNCPHNCDIYAQNIFNLVNISYDWGGGNKFFIQPRWTTFLGSARSLGSTLFNIEDPVVGFSTILYASADKKLTWKFQPGLRLPVSRATRNSDSPPFGDITHQPDIITSVSYTFNKDWSILYLVQNRVWIYEDRYNLNRHRIAHWISLTQKISEKTSLSYNYDYWHENDRNSETINGKGTHYKETWQNIYFGVGHDVTKKLNLMPMIGFYPTDAFGMQAAYLSMWISYTIK